MLTTDQIEKVKNSWAKVKPISETAAELFYARLFELNPNTRKLFKNDMKEQGQKLMSMITTAVDNLDNIEEIVSAVQDLGKRHVDYGVHDTDYDSVGNALLWTLAQGLKEDFTPEVKAAWANVYELLATTMKDAARNP